MFTTYHLSSAQEVNSDILDSIKATFKSKPITIIVEEDDQEDYNLSPEMKTILDQRLMEDQGKYISSNDSIKKLFENYGL
jgi:hypothetical protein